jgi:hypothetical protein
LQARLTDSFLQLVSGSIVRNKEGRVFLAPAYGRTPLLQHPIEWPQPALSFLKSVGWKWELAQDMDLFTEIAHASTFGSDFDPAEKRLLHWFIDEIQVWGTDDLLSAWLPGQSERVYIAPYLWYRGLTQATRHAKKAIATATASGLYFGRFDLWEEVSLYQVSNIPLLGLDGALPSALRQLGWSQNTITLFTTRLTQMYVGSYCAGVLLLLSCIPFSFSAHETNDSPPRKKSEKPERATQVMQLAVDEIIWAALQTQNHGGSFVLALVRALREVGDIAEWTDLNREKNLLRIRSEIQHFFGTIGDMMSRKKLFVYQSEELLKLALCESHHPRHKVPAFFQEPNQLVPKQEVSAPLPNDVAEMGLPDVPKAPTNDWLAWERAGLAVRFSIETPEPDVRPGLPLESYLTQRTRYTLPLPLLLFHALDNNPLVSTPPPAAFEREFLAVTPQIGPLVGDMPEFAAPFVVSCSNSLSVVDSYVYAFSCRNSLTAKGDFLEHAIAVTILARYRIALRASPPFELPPTVSKDFLPRRDWVPLSEVLKINEVYEFFGGNPKVQLSGGLWRSKHQLNTAADLKKHRINAVAFNGRNAPSADIFFPVEIFAESQHLVGDYAVALSGKNYGRGSPALASAIDIPWDNICDPHVLFAIMAPTAPKSGWARVVRVGEKLRLLDPADLATARRRIEFPQTRQALNRLDMTKLWALIEDNQINTHGIANLTKAKLIEYLLESSHTAKLLESKPTVVYVCNGDEFLSTWARFRFRHLRSRD